MQGNTLFSTTRTQDWQSHLPSQESRKTSRADDETGARRIQILPMLLKLMGDADSGVRRAAAWTLGEYFKTATSEERAQILPLILKLAGDKDWGVRHAAAWALGEYFKTATPEERAQILPRLLKPADDENWRVRHVAASTLGECCKTATPEERAQILPRLLKLEGDKDSDVRPAVTQALGECFKTATPGEQAQILPRLLMLVSEKDLNIRLVAAQALGECFKTATPEEQAQILPRLLMLTDDENSAVRSAAARALGKCFTTATPEEQAQILPRLLLLLVGEKDLNVCYAATQALGECFKTATPEEQAQILPKLLELADDKNSAVRRAAAQALGECCKTTIPNERAQILPRLLKFAGDTDSTVRDSITSLLSSLGKTDFPLTIFRMLFGSFASLRQQKNPDVRRTLAKGLIDWTEGKETISILAELTELLRTLAQDEDNLVRVFAEMALVKLQIRFNLEDSLKQIALEREEEAIEEAEAKIALPPKEERISLSFLFPVTPSSSREVQAPTSEPAGNDVPIFLAEAKNSEQRGWNCFDVAIGLSRERLIEFVIANKHDPVFRKLLAPEIKTAAQVTAVLGNMQDNKTKDPQTQDKDLQDLSDLPHVAEQFGKKEEAEEVLLHIQEKLDQSEEHFSPLNALTRRFIFIPSSGGQQNTSIVDIAARALNKKIIIHQREGTTFEEICRTEYEGNGIVHLQYNGYDHFTALKYNPAYVEGVNRELVTKFGLFKPPTSTEQPQAQMQHEEVQIADIVLKYLA